jgi:hypothetical protein
MMLFFQRSAIYYQVPKNIGANAFMCNENSKNFKMSK